LRIPDSCAHAVDQLLVSVTEATVTPGGEYGDDFKHIIGKLLAESVFALVDDDHLDLFRLA